jgi:hypothetical protein
MELPREPGCLSRQQTNSIACQFVFEKEANEMCSSDPGSPQGYGKLLDASTVPCEDQDFLIIIPGLGLQPRHYHSVNTRVWKHGQGRILSCPIASCPYSILGSKQGFQKS